MGVGTREGGVQQREGGFNNVIGQEVLDSVAKSDKRGWGKWLGDFFRPRKFDVEWDEDMGQLM